MEKDSLCEHVIFERNGKERPGFRPQYFIKSSRILKLENDSPNHMSNENYNTISKRLAQLCLPNARDAPR